MSPHKGRVLTGITALSAIAGVLAVSVLVPDGPGTGLRAPVWPAVAERGVGQPPALEERLEHRVLVTRVPARASRSRHSTVRIISRSRARSSRIARPEPAAETIGTSVWDRLAQCESGGNWQINTGNGYYGGLQFDLQTWHSYGGTGRPDQHSRSEQIAIAVKLRAARHGYSAWPACSRKLGL